LRTHRAFIALLASAAALGIYAVSRGTALTVDPRLGLSLLAALAIVGVFDVWLPRGDYTEMGAPLVLAAALLTDPITAASAVVLARVLVWATRMLAENPWRVVEDTARRLALMSLCIGAYHLLTGVLPPIAQGASLPLAAVSVVALAYLLLDLIVTQLSASLRFGVPFMPLLLGNVRLRGWMGTAQLSAALLAVITYGTMKELGLAIVVGLLLVTRQSFSLLVDIRQAYRSTVEALARAIEAHDPTRRGHAERVAALSVETARVLGQHGRRLEALTYAALFHDVGKLDAVQSTAAPGSAEVLKNVGFLAASVPILRIVDAGGGMETSQDETDLVSAYIVARMCEFDDVSNGLAPSREGAAAADIGARLYASTRRGVDRAVRRVELQSASGRLLLTKAELEESW